MVKRTQEKKPKSGEIHVRNIRKKLSVYFENKTHLQYKMMSCEIRKKNVAHGLTLSHQLCEIKCKRKEK